MNKFDDKSLQVDKKYLKKAKFEFFQRMYFYMIPTAQKRVKWLKKKEKFALLGEHVHWQPRKYPTDGRFLKIHDNVAIAADVEFTMHDIIQWVFNGIAGKREYLEYRGCIEIHENVFVGAGTRILPNVSIGPNAIIAANSLINKDVPAGAVVGGVPAKVIGDFNSVMNKRKEFSNINSELSPDELTQKLWEDFNKKHQI